MNSNQTFNHYDNIVNFSRILANYFPNRTSIFHDNIDNVSRILANYFNVYLYTDPHIKDWCSCNNVVNNNTTNVLRPSDRNFQRFVDAVTSQNIDPIRLTLTESVQTYQQIFPSELASLVNFMKFVLGITYLLRNSNEAHLEDVCPFIGITYFVYYKIEISSLLNSNFDNKSLILRDIRNLWSIFLFKKTNSHSNLNGEWDNLVQETINPISPNPFRVNLTPVFNIIDSGTSRATTPLSVYIQNSLIQALDKVLSI